MKGVVGQIIRTNMAAVVAFAPVCFLVAVLSGASHRPDWLILGAGELVCIWIMLLALAGTPASPRVLLTLPARSKSWASAVWVQRVGMPFAAMVAVCLTCLVVLVLARDTSQSPLRIVLLALWTGPGLAVSSFVGYAASRRPVRAPMWYAVLLVLLAASWLMIEHGPNRTLLHNAGFGAVVALCTLSLCGSFLLRHRIFMASAGCHSSRTGSHSKDRTPLHFHPPGILFAVFLSNPLPRILLPQFGFVMLVAVLMIWIGRGSLNSTILCVLMAGSMGIGHWTASWRALIRVSVSLPLGKLQVLLLSVVMTVLAAFMILAVIMLLLLWQHLLIAPLRGGWERCFSLQPLLLGVTLLFAVPDLNFDSVYGRILLGVPLAGLTMGFCSFYLESPDMVGPAPVLCGGFLVVGISLWLLVRSMRHALNNSDFYRGKVTE